MSISIQKLMLKMEEEIKNAKASSSETKTRERIQAIKTLCELILDEPESSEQKMRMAAKNIPGANPLSAANSIPLANLVPGANSIPSANLAPAANPITAANPGRKPMPSAINQQQRLNIDDDDANGESLFDF